MVEKMSSTSHIPYRFSSKSSTATKKLRAIQAYRKEKTVPDVKGPPQAAVKQTSST
ncbi:hypothetical protein J41TS2_06790 [Bacillus sonorensis]|nr:hypothetical protein J41TS2_06790 [Bacillus sonorensis]